MAAEPTFLDTNVLVYSIDRAEELRRTRAVELLESPPAGGYVISSQVLGEFFTVATRKLGMSSEQAREGARRFQRLSRTGIDDALVLGAIDLCAEKSITYWDALIVSAAARLGCDILLTEDLNAGETIAGVQIVNPF